MSLHRYFKSKSKDNELSSTVIPVAATIAGLTSNEQNEVFNAIENIGTTSGKQGSYRKYDEKLRCEVAKFAITASIKSAARKYGIPVNTVRGFKKSYEAKKRETPNKDVSSLPQKKRGRPTLLPEEIDEKVMDMASSMRLSGAVVNYNVLIAIAKGIITANDRTLLTENGGTNKLGFLRNSSYF